MTIEKRFTNIFCPSKNGKIALRGRQPTQGETSRGLQNVYFISLFHYPKGVTG